MDGGAGSGHTVLGGVHRRRPTKKTKQPKKKPIKVVYISNPMKIQTSASQFMALVQELTGQDADFPDPSKFPAAVDPALDKTASAVGGDDDSNLINPSQLAVELPAEDLDSYSVDGGGGGGLENLDSFYDAFDDLIFPPPVIGNFSGFLPAPPPAAIYESYAR